MINGRKDDWKRRRFMAACWSENANCDTIMNASEVIIDLESAVDVGNTKSNKNHPIHFITGLIVVTIGFSVVMFAVRAVMMG